MDEIEVLKARVAALEAEVAAIKRVRVVAQTMTAHQMREKLGAKAVRPAEDKAVRMREDK